MEQIISFFAMMYPATLPAVVFLVAIWYLVDTKEKKSKFLNFLIFFTIAVYFISFFTHYNFELFLIISDISTVK